ncbi:MAG: bacillithiol biosynthesis deacetylase BshB1 [Flavobacteriales bacterium]|nr:bacillithiol biosynthesis deacetylase BshB1 [Flavobacteriales bacterium]
MSHGNLLMGAWQPVDILAFGAHPDDVELGCGGTLAQEIQNGLKVAVCELSAGEAGTRGTPEIRREESVRAAEILGLSARVQLDFPDGLIREGEVSLKKIIEIIRIFKPRIVIANAPRDRHPDHGHAAHLVRDAAFLAGLSRLETGSAPHRPAVVLHYIQFYDLQPQLYISVDSDAWKVKMESIKAHKSQFYDPQSKEPETLISKPDFLDFVESRGRNYGLLCGTYYAEGFLAERPPSVSRLSYLL